MTPELPSDRRSLEAIVAEAAAAERTVAARIANCEALLAVGRQASNPIFSGPAAQAHLANELGRLRIALTEPVPRLALSGPYLSLPPEGELHAMEPVATLRLFHRELIRVHRTAMTALAEIETQQQKPNTPPRGRRNQGKARAGLEYLKEEWRAGRDAPTLSDLMRRFGWKSTSPAYAAYEMFYDWDEYKDHLRDCPNDGWGPGPKPPGKRRR